MREPAFPAIFGIQHEPKKNISLQHTFLNDPTDLSKQAIQRFSSHFYLDTEEVKKEPIVEPIDNVHVIKQEIDDTLDKVELGKNFSGSHLYYVTKLNAALCLTRQEIFPCLCMNPQQSINVYLKSLI